MFGVMFYLSHDCISYVIFKMSYIQNIDMDEAPSRLPSGKLGCPKCYTALSKDKAPFYLHGEYVGIFESYVCPICTYFAFTLDGYENARIRAKQLSLVDTAPDIPDISAAAKLSSSVQVGGNNNHTNPSNDVEPKPYPELVSKLPQIMLPVATKNRL